MHTLTTMKKLLMFALLIALTTAHLDKEIRIEKDNVVFDIGISPEQPNNEQLTTMIIFIVNKTTKKPIETAAWVRISKGDEIILSTYTATINKGINIALKLNPGIYDVEINSKHGKALFKLEVKERFPYDAVAVVMLIIGLVLLYRYVKHPSCPVNN